MAHDHSHVHTRKGEAGHGHAGHSHGESPGGWRYGVAIAVNVMIVVAQAIAGFAYDSTALLADAGHNATDALGLVMAGIAVWAMARPASAKRSYGFRKAGILAALANSVLLLLACAVLLYDAIDSLWNPPEAPPPGLMVMLVAVVAAGVNLLSAWLLSSGHPDDVNRRAAVVHLLADGLVSVGVILTGLAIWLTGAKWLDPVATLLIVAFIVASSWKLLVQSFDMTLDAVPYGVDLPAIKAWMESHSGVLDVHDLHIWSLSPTEMALTAHMMVEEDAPSAALLCKLQAELVQVYGIRHSTIQLEQGAMTHADLDC